MFLLPCSPNILSKAQSWPSCHANQDQPWFSLCLLWSLALPKRFVLANSFNKLRIHIQDTKWSPWGGRRSQPVAQRRQSACRGPGKAPTGKGTAYSGQALTQMFRCCLHEVLHVSSFFLFVSPYVVWAKAMGNQLLPNWNCTCWPKHTPFASRLAWQLLADFLQIIVFLETPLCGSPVVEYLKQNVWKKTPLITGERINQTYPYIIISVIARKQLVGSCLFGCFSFSSCDQVFFVEVGTGRAMFCLILKDDQKRSVEQKAEKR